MKLKKEEEEEEEVPYMERERDIKIKDEPPKQRFELVHQPEILGVRDNKTGEVERFVIEQEIIDIKNKLDKLLRSLT